MIRKTSSVTNDGVGFLRNGLADSAGVLVDLMVAGLGPIAEGTDDNVGVAVGVVIEENTELIVDATADGVGSRLPGDETKVGIALAAVETNDTVEQSTEAGDVEPTASPTPDSGKDETMKAQLM